MHIAHVIPLFKTGGPMVLTNYRPVSVLPVFSKLLERLTSCITDPSPLLIYTNSCIHINSDLEEVTLLTWL